MSTAITKKATIKRAWHLVDLKDKVLGREATKIAQLLIGKAKTYFTPSLDCGDYVVVTNAALVKFTGAKLTGKIYRHHTGHPGGFKEFTLSEMLVKDPRRVITLSVAGMLPKNKLRATRLKRLKVFAGSEHSYSKIKELNHAS